VIEPDRLQAVELHRPGLRGLTVDPDAPLGELRRIVDPADEVPADRPPVRGFADAGRPAPDRVVRVVALGLVLDAARLGLDATAGDPDVALDWHVDALSGPDVLAIGGRADHLDPLHGAEAKEGPDLSGLRVLGLDPDHRPLVGTVHEKAVAV